MKRLMKLFQLNNYIYNISHILKCHNFIVNKLARPVSSKEIAGLCKSLGIRFGTMHITDRDLYWTLLTNHSLQKQIEFYVTYTLLDIKPNEVYMDVAGGINTYIDKINCKKKYLQDIRISDNIKLQLGTEIDYIESDAGNIQLPDESVDKISVHHSFEHFQDNSDILFIKDVQRLLKKGGKCCMIPIFIARKFFEVTAAINFSKKFSKRSKRIIDPTALVSGGTSSGNYARFYDIQAFKERVIDMIDLVRFKVTIAELKMEGMVMPKTTTLVECPYKALIIEKEKE